jgi:hypothetical protein
MGSIYRGRCCSVGTTTGSARHGTLTTVLYCSRDTDFHFSLLFDHLMQVSKEGDTFEVALAVAKMSELVKTMIDGKQYNVSAKLSSFLILDSTFSA